MTGKVFSKNYNWYIEFENGIVRKFVKTNFFGDFGYVNISGKKVEVEINFDTMVAKTF